MSLCLHMISYDKQFLLSTNTPIFFFFVISINMDCVKMKSLTGSKDVFPFFFFFFCSRGAESECVSDAEDVGHAVPVV